MRKCKACKCEKHISEFNEKGKYTDTLCKDCRKEKQERTVKVIKKTKKCSCCKIEKKRSEFTVNERKKGVEYLSAKCKVCRSKEYTKKPKYKCSVCESEKTERFFNLVTNKCHTCEKNKGRKDRNKATSLDKGYRETESIFELEKRLKKEGKAIAKDNVKTEAWKLANGYTWVTEEVPFTKFTTRKQRVLRKVDK